MSKSPHVRNTPKSKSPQSPKATARFKAEICHNSIQNIRVVPKIATVDIHTSRKHGVKSYLKGLSGLHPSALAHSSRRHDGVAVTPDLLAEREDGTSRTGCAEEGLSTSMTASCDVPKPRADEEVCNADVEGRENRRIKLNITQPHSLLRHCIVSERLEHSNEQQANKPI